VRVLQLLVGTYTSEGAEGIYACDFDPERGALSTPVCVARTPQPSFLAAHPDRPLVVVVEETSDPDGRSGGFVAAFRRDESTRRLHFINRQPSAGGAPCHVSCHPGGRWIAAANYGCGSVVVLPVLDDGSLGAASCIIRHQGRGADPERQAGPHAHGIVFDPSGRYALAPDLGVDRLMVYRFDEASGTPAAVGPGWPARPGAGPRVLRFHPDGRRALLINELDNTLTLLTFDPDVGDIRELDTQATLPSGWRGASAAADVHIHPGGKFAFASNRGHDSIATFAVRDAGLSPLRHVPAGGRTPRGFTLDPTGRWLIAAGQKSNVLTVFRIDGSSGVLTTSGPPVPVPAPVCLQWTAASRRA
jgi:6-phosphogluconolactonase